MLSKAPLTVTTKYPITEKPLTGPDVIKTYDDIFNLQKTVKLLLWLLGEDISAVSEISDVVEIEGDTITLPAKAHRVCEVKLRGNSYYIPLYKIPNKTLELVATPAMLTSYNKGTAITPVVFTVDPTQPAVQYLVEGELPPGLVLTITDSVTATLSGTPTANGNYSFSVVAKTRSGSTVWESYNCEVKTPALYTYWKLVQKSRVGTGATYAQIGEIKYGGVVASGGTATADSSYAPGYTPDKAFNGVNDSGWCSNAAAYPHWITYQFSTPKTFTNVTLVAAASTDNQFAPDAFDILVSNDGTTWTLVYSNPGGQPGWGSVESRTFNF